MGVLDRLPPELVSMVLQGLDVLSFFRFRQVNRRARIVSTDDPREYQLVTTHGLEGLRGLLRAQLAPYFTIHDLCSALLTRKCVACGQFGGHLFLFTVERCCVKCLVYSPRFQVCDVSGYAQFSGISQAQLESLPGVRMRTVPGLYGFETKDQPVSRPDYLLSVDATTQNLLSTDAISKGRVPFLSCASGSRSQRFMAATAFPYFNLRRRTLWTGVSCKGCQIHLETVNRGFRRRYRLSSERGFLAHFTRCGDAQDIWRRSEGGVKSVEVAEFARNGGVMNPLGPDGLPA